MSVPGQPEFEAPAPTQQVQAVSYRPRTRQPWEAYVVSACIALVTVVVAVSLCILAIASLLFGLAELSAHWPT